MSLEPPEASEPGDPQPFVVTEVTIAAWRAGYRAAQRDALRILDGGHREVVGEERRSVVRRWARALARAVAG